MRMFLKRTAHVPWVALSAGSDIWQAFRSFTGVRADLTFVFE